MLTTAVLTWGFALTAGLLAAETTDPQKAAVTRLEDVDADYALQGEYTGRINGCYGCQTVGLQVVAGGNGEFQALLYPGGLPGNGYYGASKTTLTGQRDDQGVHLTADGWRVRLQTGLAATVSSSNGAVLGYLQPIRRYSLTEGARPPANAQVLFDGTDTGLLKDVKISPEGFLQIGAETIHPVQDFQLHGEFKTPYMPYARGQARGNSGFYVQRRYEVQVLDSFGMEPAVNEVASLYKFKAPDMNMSFPPLVWQTYDIHFTAARFNDQGERTAKARITVWHNGVVVQNQVELENKTGGGRPEGPEPLPILLQNHGNPVEFRNIWIVDTTPTAGTTCATATTSCCSVRRSVLRKCR
ncbi:DUF1080 domain-containing protein [bacterium]|nr:DUF1080 domain-containing protein [bacterium]